MSATARSPTWGASTVASTSLDTMSATAAAPIGPAVLTELAPAADW